MEIYLNESETLYLKVLAKTYEKQLKESNFLMRWFLKYGKMDKFCEFIKRANYQGSQIKIDNFEDAQELYTLTRSIELSGRWTKSLSAEATGLIITRKLKAAFPEVSMYPEWDKLRKEMKQNEED